MFAGFRGLGRFVGVASTTTEPDPEPITRSSSQPSLPSPSSIKPPTSSLPTRSISGLPTPSPSPTSPVASALPTPPPKPLSIPTPRSEKKTGKDACHVTVRVRPLTANEEAVNGGTVWQVETRLGRIGFSEEFAERNRKAVTDYVFDAVQTGSDNKQLYEGSARAVVRASMEGFNGTVFAYGQTASGKTYSMMGVDEQPGVIPQAVEDIFAYIREQSGDREYLLRVSYMEIYNETIRDLLAPDQVDLRIHEDRKRGVFVSPLKEEIVTSPKQVMRIIKKGEENRHFGATDYNEHSSRSHTIFQMVIESRERSQPSPGTPRRTGSGRAKGAVTISQLNLIDLAGSEKATSDTDRRKEGAYINKSLLTLGTVISKLTDEKNTGLHIPYRDSKLTRILQSSLAGNARISVICTISPASPNSEETVNTLKFAARVKKVTIKASANRIMDEKALIQKYREEIEDLKQKLTETNMLLEKERQQQLSVSVIDTEKKKYEEQLHEGQIVRTALKERIDHLTNLILTSKTITSKQLLDWSAPVEAGSHRSSVMMEDGLLPTSAGPSKRMTRHISDKEFLKRHIREIDERDEKIRHLTLLIGQLKTSRDPFVVSQISEFEQSGGTSIQEFGAVFTELESMRRQKEELESVVRSQEDKLDVVEKMRRTSTSQYMMDDLISENKALKSTLASLRLEYRTLQSTHTTLSSQLSTPTFESSRTYQEMTETMTSQRTQITQLITESKSLRNTVKSLRDSIRMLELSNDMFVQSASRLNDDSKRASHHSDKSGSSTETERRDMELALERERKLRLEEQRMATERIAGLEAELAIAKAELGVVQMIPVFSKS
ncbi:hypothetical protein SpCBS45565_g06393 [Spizellomyces sp. 'palustris']|nr:hypothetical protein SpCBS45565_g06393 [Spizellomyces sp. 'palustris']